MKSLRRAAFVCILAALLAGNTTNGALAQNAQEPGESGRDAAAPPAAQETWRVQTGLGTFEMNPQARQRLKELAPTLRETAKEIEAVIQEKVKLTAQEEATLRSRLKEIREEVTQLIGPIKVEKGPASRAAPTG
jgi:hypothetical protein